MRDFLSEARAAVLAEDAAKFEARIRDKARLLREADRQVIEGMWNFPQTAAERKARLDQLRVREKALAGPPPEKRNPYLPTKFVAAVPRITSAAADAELIRLRAQIFELERWCKRDGTLSKEVA
jgi:hypothetical protein